MHATAQRSARPRTETRQAQGHAASRSPLVREMAQFIADQTLREGACTREDLKRRGYSDRVLDRNLDQAREEARNLATRRGFE